MAARILQAMGVERENGCKQLSGERVAQGQEVEDGLDLVWEMEVNGRYGKDGRREMREREEGRPFS